ncbi:MAG: ROK family protein [Caldisericaceae bacterium]
MGKNVLGIDIGGTKINGTILDEKGTLLKELKVPTGDTEHGSLVLSRIVYVIENLKKGFDVEALGFGVAGFIDNNTGIVKSSPNIKCFNDFNIVETFEKKFNVKTFVDNDAKSAAIYELFFGQGKDANDFVLVALGTGIGSAIVVNRHIVRGKNNMAGEIGHLTLDEHGRLCGCGKIGCFETISSGPAIRQSVIESIMAGRKTSLIELSNNDTNAIDVPLITRAASLGDQLSLEILTNAAHYVGLVLSYLANILNPEKIILTGGLLNAFTPVNNVITEAFEKFTLPIPRQAVKIIYSSMNENAVSIGAAINALKKLTGETI